METVDAKTIITRNKSTEWFGASYNMNIYRGCCHGCIYCDSRSACYHVDDFETVRAKKNALRLIRDELRRKVRTGVIATGSMSDPYNPFEERELLTRHGLELIDAFGFGVSIATKSDLIARDLDILDMIRGHSPVVVEMTVTTTDDELAAQIEPGAPAPSRRLAAIRKLSEQGIFTGILLMPVLPFIEDNPENITSVFRAAKENGARFVYPMFGMTMREKQREYFYKQLDALFPGMRERYEQRYGNYYVCHSPRTRALGRILLEESSRLGLLTKMPDIISASQLGYENTQLTMDV